MRHWLRDNSLGLAFGLAFVLTLVGQAIAGRAEFNQQLAVDGLQQIGFVPFLTSSDFAVDVSENWQSEYLQFFLYIFGTVWLVQRGSPESKKLDKAGTGVRQGPAGRRARHDTHPRWAAAERLATHPCTQSRSVW